MTGDGTLASEGREEVYFFTGSSTLRAMDEHTEPDETLMLRYGQGDVAAFETLYARHRGPLFRYLRRQCGRREVAEELFQDVWMGIINAREGYDVRARFTTYLYRIAHNRVIDHVRRRTPEPAAGQQDGNLVREEPEERLDQTILSAARHHVEVEHEVAHSPFSRNWVVPASLAAVVVLSVSVVLLMAPPAPELDGESTVLAPAAVGKPEAAHGPDDADRQGQRATKGSTPLLSQPEPKAESLDTSGIAPPPATAGRRRNLAPSAASRSEADEIATGHATPTTDASVSESEEKQEITPEAWLTQIAELRRQGLYHAAEAQLAAFRDRYPDFPAEAFLRGLGPAASQATPGQAAEPLPSGVTP